MKTVKHLIISIVTLIIFGCNATCAKSKLETDRISYNASAFVQVFQTTKIISCHDKKDKNCPIGERTQTGSGVKLHLVEGESTVLTAGHVCDTEPSKKIKLFLQTVAIRDVYDRVHQAWPIKITFHDAEKGTGDLCLLWVPTLVGYPTAKLSNKKPVVGSDVYYLGAPMGIFHPPTVPIFKGVFSGRMDESSSMITAPAIGGSSGGPVFNDQHKIVGILFAANREFHHVSVIVNYKILVNFLLDSKKIINFYLQNDKK